MPIPHCHLLHWSVAAGSAPDVPEHSHGYFQIEFCIDGRIRFIGKRNDFILKADEWMLIPPETPHRITYGGNNLKYYSFKFELKECPVIWEKALHFQPATTLSRWAAEAFASQHPACKLAFLPLNENRAILEALLWSLVSQVVNPGSGASEMPKLLQDLSNLVTEQGAKINVQYAADQLKMSVSQLKYRYRQLQLEPGSVCRDATIKEFLDRKLMEIIDQSLFFSRISFLKLAAQTNFNNVYTFSRFVKRVTGETPSIRRNAFIAASESSRQSQDRMAKVKSRH